MAANNDDGKHGPELVTLWVVVPEAERCEAERWVKAFAEGGLEEVLAAFVHLLAEVRERPYSVPGGWVSAWLASHPWPRSGTEGAT
jgi:hypothetical protein